jgi:hypothetical protein
MYRHQLRFVLRFGVREQFDEFIERLQAAETARGLTKPRVWQTVNGLVNEIVIEHDYESFDAFRRERTAFHENPDEVGEVLAALGDLCVPATANQSDLDELELATANG